MGGMVGGNRSVHIGDAGGAGTLIAEHGGKIIFGSLGFEYNFGNRSKVQFGKIVRASWWEYGSPDHYHVVDYMGTELAVLPDILI
jgi:hypothetical protein